MKLFRRLASRDVLLVPWGLLLIWLLGRWLQPAPEVGVLRPQEPLPPFPYTSMPLTFASGALRLAGTLTVPPGPGPHPAVVLISGAGAQDRDGTLAGHRRYLVLADFLSRAGIAVLRTDDRGVGDSEGDTMAALLSDLAGDTRAAIRALGEVAQIDRRRIGLLGASQGSLVAAQVAAEDPAVAFVVLVSPPGLPGEQTLVEQNLLMARATGASEADLVDTRRLLEEALELRGAQIDNASKRRQLRRVARRLTELRSGPATSLVGGESRLEAQVDVMLSPSFADQLETNPRTFLARSSQPVLALWGDLDLQVPPDLHRPPVEQALAESGNPDVELVSLPGLNHLLQPATTGLPVEYAEIGWTWAPQALTTIGDWLRQRALNDESAEVAP